MSMIPKEPEELKIVIIDDSDFSRKNIIEILESQGYNVVGQAASAEEAMKVAVTTPANLFIVDVVMPEMSGIEIIKNFSDNKIDAKFIMMSSLQLEGLLIESISNGAIDFLYKPFEADDLLKAVGKAKIEIEKEN